MNPAIREEIIRRLHVVEQEHDLTILYASESGSRAWQFASPDSDYDVRFIYARQLEHYLSFDVERQRDVIDAIEYPIVDDIDLVGWDLRKTMYLLTRTNGALIEWLQSPIVYIDKLDIAVKLRELISACFDATALCYHYSHMARGNAKEYLFKDQAKLKKYFYVLRPLLAIRYIQAFKELPPIEFEQLVDAVAPDNIRDDIGKLLTLKRNTPEMGYGPPVTSISQFIEAELERHGDSFSGQGRPDLQEKTEAREALNQIFFDTVTAGAG
ncbi:MAG: nucleotidyltransferase domain-containing protein [Pseudomonadota bacterium]